MSKEQSDIPYQFSEEFQMLQRLQDEAAKNPWAKNVTDAARRTTLARTRIEKLVSLHPYLKHEENGIDLIGLEKVAKELYEKKSQLEEELEDKDFKALRCEEIKISILRETLKLKKEQGKLVELSEYETHFLQYSTLLNGALDMFVAEVAAISKDPAVVDAAKQIRDRIKLKLVNDLEQIQQKDETKIN